jgi:pyruvate carboxylase subunit B
VFNVLAGRYKMVSRETKDYFFGLYGRPPAPVNEEIRRLVLKGYERGETPIDCRPADILEPELPKAKEALSGITDKMEDILTYALYPVTGLEFIKRKYGL